MGTDKSTLLGDLLCKSASMALRHFVAIARSVNYPLDEAALMLQRAWVLAERANDEEYGLMMSESFQNLLVASRELALFVADTKASWAHGGNGGTGGN